MLKLLQIASTNEKWMNKHRTAIFQLIFTFELKLIKISGPLYTNITIKYLNFIFILSNIITKHLQHQINNLM